MMTQVKYQNKYLSPDFPGGAVQGKGPASAWDMGSIPGPGSFHKATRQRSQSATTTEARML